MLVVERDDGGGEDELSELEEEVEVSFEEGLGLEALEKHAVSLAFGGALGAVQYDASIVREVYKQERK